MNVLVISLIVVLILLAVVQIILLLRKPANNLDSLQSTLLALGQSTERIERSVRDEISKNREESNQSARQSREEMAATLKDFNDSLIKNIGEMSLMHKTHLDGFSERIDKLVVNNEQRLVAIRETVETKLTTLQNESTTKLDQVRQEATTAAKLSREELAKTLKGTSDILTNTLSDMGASQRSQLTSVVEQLERLTESTGKKLDFQKTAIDDRMKQIQNDSTQQSKQLREEVGVTLKAFNDSLLKGLASMAEGQQKQMESFSAQLNVFRGTLTATLNDMGGNQRIQLSSVVDQLEKLTESSGKKLDTQKTVIDERMKQIQTDAALHSKQLRDEVGTTLKAFNDSLLKGLASMADGQQKQMESFSGQLNKLTESNEQKLDLLKTAVELKLTAIQEDNTKQLEKMRETVDEKLQSTLEKRLGESFKQVGERLEQVHKGLGEMQSLASGVGDLKKVLTNVKSRGTWGEVQLGNLLEQVLAPDQYATNVATKDGGECVEFAVKLPGKSAEKDEVVWLPIDAKYPMEDYQRLIEAQENGDIVLADAAMKQLESRIKQEAVTIRNKYLNPPKTTDFAILFLPTEGLFAEVLRRPGLSDLLQREYRVMVAGPTTLWSLLNSLQMGFKTLAIEQRSSEVWNLLGAVKTEWSKYGDILAKVQKKLHEATDTIEDVHRRSRAVGRKLKMVQELPISDAETILMLDTTSANADHDLEEE